MRVNRKKSTKECAHEYEILFPSHIPLYFIKKKVSARVIRTEGGHDHDL